MGKLHCGMQTQQWIMVLFKTLRKTTRHNDATIFHYAHCVSLSIFNVLTVIFSVESFCRKFKKIRHLTNEYSYRADFTDLDAVYGSDDGLKTKLTQVKHFLIYLEKSLSQLIMKQTIVLVLIDNQGIVWIPPYRWRCGLLVIIVIVYDVSIVLVYDVSLLLSMTYQFQSRFGKKLTTWIFG